MKKQSSLLALSMFLMTTGILLLVTVAAVYAYARVETWARQQPRSLSSQQIVLPTILPITPWPLPTATNLPTPTPTPTPGPPVWVEIPRLDVERSVVQVGIIERNGALEWDVESLFATRNRADLVGHLAGSSNPGQPGNLILTGHNYNRGAYNWTGVFFKLKDLKAGDTIQVFDATNKVFTYQVETVEELSWVNPDLETTLAHLTHLLPTPDETLTLITCGGANIYPFPSRVYVTAKRIATP